MYLCNVKSMLWSSSRPTKHPGARRKSMETYDFWSLETRSVEQFIVHINQVELGQFWGFYLCRKIRAFCEGVLLNGGDGSSMGDKNEQKFSNLGLGSGIVAHYWAREYTIEGIVYTSSGSSHCSNPTFMNQISRSLKVVGNKRFNTSFYDNKLDDDDE